ncbi:MAG TPA: TonB-dependent receptor [Casimicrobiaceae bacterium]|jgi:outer membrane receptor protein involved in Fe transport|nr:TonB-dependent receptor [Casimicrobiaceae bacterium]
MPKLRALWPLAACVIASMAVTPLLAATLVGRFQDSAGNPVAGIVITLRAADGHQVAQQTTDPQGLANFADLAPGRYTVEAGGPPAGPVAQTIEITAAPSVNLTVIVPAPVRIATIQVTAARLKEARIALSPKIGTTVYTLDQALVAEYGSGDNAPMNETLLRLPGIAQDSKASGSLHVRDEHANVQYRINGIALPEGISGFGQSVDSRFVDRIDFVTGALPAQYGLRTAGVVDIEAKDGSAPGGRVGLLGGGHDTLQPSIELGGSKGGFSYYVAGNFLTDALGIENPRPTRNAIHDRTQQTRGFAYLSDVVDESTRLGAIFGTYQGNFQIPNNPDQAPSFSLTGVSDVNTGFNARPSADLDQRQREVNHYAIFSLQKSLGALDYQVSLSYQYSSLHYLPDTQGGDLIYTGVASDVFRSNSATGVQADASYKLADAHTARFGFAYTQQLTRSENNVSVFPVDAAGNQSSSTPQTIVDDSDKRGNLSGVYLQDEWRLDPRLTLNYGIRFDHVAAFTNEHQFSPRLNALWRVTDATAVHAGYSRYFTPPPQELVAQKSIELYAGTSNAPAVPVSDTVKAERAHYFDLGIAQTISPQLTLGVDAYYKRMTNLIDEGQFGQALILTPFNYAEGYIEGIEFSSTYSDPIWSGYLNLAISKGKGKNIVSGQSLFGAEELAYIADHFIYLDHDQRYSLSGGVTYRFGANRISGDVIYGSGLRRTPPGAPPNSGKLPSYAAANLALIHNWRDTPVGELEGRVGVTNIFDKIYLLRDGTGVGVGAPQYGGRRTWFVALSHPF